MPRLLVTGGSGLLGSALVKAAWPSFEVFFTYHSHPVELPGALGFPLALEEGFGRIRSLIREVRPDLIVHTAALRSLDYCESHPDEAYAVNAEGTRFLAEAASDIGARLVLISTESVFDGYQGMYREEDEPNPVTVYGRTKLRAEQVVRKIVPDALIVRTSSIYGKSLKGQSLAEFVLQELQQSRSVEMIVDSAFSPILSNNLAEVVLELTLVSAQGICHVAGPDRSTRYDFAIAVARAFGLDATLVRPVSFDQVKARFRAARARDLSLDVSRARSLLRRTRLLPLQEGLEVLKQEIQHLYPTQVPLE